MLMEENQCNREQKWKRNTGKAEKLRTAKLWPQLRIDARSPTLIKNNIIIIIIINNELN